VTQAAFAELVGVEGNSVARWERGAVRVPEPAGRFIRLLALLWEEERPTSAPGTVSEAADQLARVTLASATLSPLADYAAGRGSTRDAQTALRTLRQRGRRGRV